MEKTNFEEYIENNNNIRIKLVTTACENLLNSGIKITPKNIYNEQQNIAKTNIEIKLVVSARSLSRSALKWKNIIDIYKLKQEDESSVELNKKNLSELDLRHQNFILREKIVEMDIENKTLREVRKQQEKKILNLLNSTESYLTSDSVVTIIDEYNWKDILSGVIDTLTSHTHVTESINDNLYVFGKDGKVLLISKDILMDLHKLD